MRTRYGCAATLSAIRSDGSGCHRETTRAYHSTAARRIPLRKAEFRGRPPQGRLQRLRSSSPAPVPNSFGKPVSTEVGLASWYGPPYAGRKGADGTVYDQNAMTAAHLTLPMGTMVRVTNLTNEPVGGGEDYGPRAVCARADHRPLAGCGEGDRSLSRRRGEGEGGGVCRAGVGRMRDPGGRWCVQIGAFSRESDAVKLKNDLMRRYTTAKVIEFPGPTGYWVRVNPKFPDKRTATEVADGIHPKDPAAEPYLIRTD